MSVTSNFPLMPGWSAMIVALILSGFAIHRQKIMLIWIGMILLLPVSYYLTGSPGLGLFGLVPIGSLFFSAAAMHYQHRRLPWVGVTGCGLFVATLLAFVLTPRQVGG